MIFSKALFFGVCLCFVLMLIGIAGQKFQILPFKAAFGGFALGLLVAALIAVVGLVMIFLSFGVISAEHRNFMFGAFVLGILPLIVVIGLVGAGLKVPRIHDISTNLDNNIEFLNAHTLRDDSHNSLDLPSSKVAEMHRAFYRDIQPLVLADSEQDAYEKARSTALSLGWEITHENKDRQQFEAIEKTALFGFVDDIAVRISAHDKGSVIDLRSVSRVGQSDLGANGKRIKRFQDAYKGR